MGVMQETEAWAEVDLRDGSFEDVVDLRFGVPGGCVQCGGPAVLAHVDMGARVSRHECPSCDREWWVSDTHPGIEFRSHP